MTVDTNTASLYLQGDPTAIYVDLAPTAVLHMLREAEELAARVDAKHLVFCPLPLRSGDEGYVRPGSVSAVLPGWDDDDDD